MKGIMGAAMPNNAPSGDLIPIWLCFTVVMAFGRVGMLLAYLVFSKSIK